MFGMVQMKFRIQFLKEKENHNLANFENEKSFSIQVKTTDKY